MLNANPEIAMTTLSTLGGVQLNRAAAFPAKFADNPFRAVALSTLQRRNAALDSVFYDVGVITPEETPDLAFWLAREGAIVAVPPSGQGRLRLFLTPEEFYRDGGAVAALTVAGGGSSALRAPGLSPKLPGGPHNPGAGAV